MAKDNKKTRFSGLHSLNDKKVLLLEKGKHGIHRAIFGRTLFIFISFLLQLLLLISIFTVLRDHLSVMLGAYYGLVVVILLIIINRNMNPNMKLPWILVSLLLPVVGGSLYLYVELSLGTKLVSYRVKEVIKQAEAYTRDDPYVMERLKEEDPGMYNLAGYLSSQGNNRIYRNSDVQYYPSGEDMLPELLSDLEKAQKFIFIEFFIIKEGLMWGQILSILKDKAEQGVKVCVMYDGFNTLLNLPVRYPKELEKIGIECKVFSPVRPVFSTIYNNRDHRKIIVIDGQVGYTGGVNLSDEYINEWERFGYWKDCAVRISGDAVQGLTGLFLQMWNITPQELSYEDYLTNKDVLTDREVLMEGGSVKEKEADAGEDISDGNLNDPEKTENEGKGFVQPYGDSPMDDELVGKNVYLTLINRAVDHIRFMTPYLVLDHETKEALIFAAKRGVEVTLLLPHIPDKLTASSLAKNHYPALLKGGVHIYEYTPGFVHAKIAEMDGQIATVGTINLDYRSLYHHFEDGVLLYHTPVIRQIKEDFDLCIGQSHEVTWKDVRNEKKLLRLMGYLLKAIAPLM